MRIIWEGFERPISTPHPKEHDSFGAQVLIFVKHSKVPSESALRAMLKIPVQLRLPTRFLPVAETWKVRIPWMSNGAEILTFRQWSMVRIKSYVFPIDPQWTYLKINAFYAYLASSPVIDQCCWKTQEGYP